MEYLQYLMIAYYINTNKNSFKPYYKWNTFNTRKQKPLIFILVNDFKPYYKWNTFNTSRKNKWLYRLLEF